VCGELASGVGMYSHSQRELSFMLHCDRCGQRISEFEIRQEYVPEPANLDLTPEQLRLLALETR